MRLVKQSVVALLAVGVVAALSSSPVVADPGRGIADTEQASRGVAAIDWTAPCDESTVERYLFLECGTLEVPLDYSDPDGKQITLALTRRKHTVPDDEYQGVMLGLRGGPGGSYGSFFFEELWFFAPDDLIAAYDWIAFDQRGTWGPNPGDRATLECDPSLRGGPDVDQIPNGYRPGDPNSAIPAEITDNEKAWLAWAEDYAEACAKNSGELLQHMGTVASVRDIESIRRALGVEQLNIQGGSYGADLAAAYATAHPHRIRRIVLDSPGDRRGDDYLFNFSQSIGAELKYSDRLASIAAENDATYKLGSTPEAVYQLLLDLWEQLRAEPVGELGPNEFQEALQSTSGVGSSDKLLTAIAKLKDDNDPTALLELIAPPPPIPDESEPTLAELDDIEYAGYLATICVDRSMPTDYRQWRHDTFRTAERAPFRAWDNTWFNAPCLFWPAPPVHEVYYADRGIDSMLILGHEFDPSTPFEGSLDMRRRFRNSALVEAKDSSYHAVTWLPAEFYAYGACLQGHVIAYLLDGSLPERVDGRRSDAQCAPAEEA